MTGGSMTGGKRGDQRPDGAAGDPELYEVFIRARRGLDHKHVGSLHASDPALALEYARDVYTRRGEGVSIWVVRSRDITASLETDAESFFDPLDAKPYRHALHYTLPDAVNNM